MNSAFDKYQKRSPDYHWQQVSRNLFRFNAYVAGRYRLVVEQLSHRKNQRILDVGCGDGVLLSLIGRGRLYGADLDQDSLDYAASRIKAKFIKAPAEKLPFRSGWFDAVIATEVIEHLKQPEKLLEEASRVLKTGGRLILTTPVKQPEGPADPLHQREFTPLELTQRCRKYFRRVAVTVSHPLWFKQIYIWSAGKFGRYHLDFGRWLINVPVLVFGWNPFINLPGRPTQQLAVCRK